ncbi:MAG TPA: lysophospholipid acyltransferase family protein, partial [Phycisphaerae bacterium]|nr:lysophospholipid acyltransferase family protein [Phycisphaerae bacterium]
PRAKLMNRIKLINREHIDAGLARGKGVYVALCHFGSHYIAGLMMAMLGYEISGLRDPKESHVRRYIQDKYRESFPEVKKLQVFPANSFPRQVYRRLQGNTIVTSLIDPDRRRGENTKTASVRMFGEDREILAGPLQIAFRCGATMLQGFVVSRRNFYYQLIVTPPLIEPGRERDDEETLAVVAQHYADRVEKFARENPDHLMNI